MNIQSSAYNYCNMHVEISVLRTKTMNVNRHCIILKWRTIKHFSVHHPQILLALQSKLLTLIDSKILPKGSPQLIWPYGPHV